MFCFFRFWNIFSIIFIIVLNQKMQQPLFKVFINELLIIHKGLNGFVVILYFLDSRS